MKNIMIFGDSYSTFAGCIPEGHAAYYTGKRTSADESPDVPSADHTWWGLLVKETGVNLVRNDSWSGSTIGYTGWGGKETSKTSSFIYRLETLASEGFFEKNEIDTVFVFGGTNDSWSNAPLGEETYADFREDELFSVLPAICHFMTVLKQDHPHTRVVFIGNCDIKREILDCMKRAAQQLSVDFVELHDIDKINGHPTVLGMTQICDQIMEKL